jgi:phenylacetate-coenzyme A ligase PaaK-like adenylate-forming protein
MLIYPEAVLASLDTLLGATPYLLSVQSTEPGQALSADRLVLRLEAEPDEARARQLADEVKRACGVTPELQFEAAGRLAPTGGSWKAKKFVDLRSAH